MRKQGIALKNAKEDSILMMYRNDTTIVTVMENFLVALRNEIDNQIIQLVMKPNIWKQTTATCCKVIISSQLLRKQEEVKIECLKTSELRNHFNTAKSEKEHLI